LEYQRWITSLEALFHPSTERCFFICALNCGDPSRQFQINQDHFCVGMPNWFAYQGFLDKRCCMFGQAKQGLGSPADQPACQEPQVGLVLGQA
jgi:hypothetical protein